MGCSSSLLMSPSDAWGPCGSDEPEDDEVEWSSASSLVDGSQSSCGCSMPSNSNFDLSQVHPSQPPYLGSSYWHPNEPERFFTRTPPPPLTMSPSDSGTDACSTSDSTLVISNLATPSDNSMDSFVPRRLFDDDSSPSTSTPGSNDDSNMVIVKRPHTPVVVRQGVVIKGKLESPAPSHASCSTNKKRHRRIDTLPSTREGRPIRLKVVESYSRGDDDSCTYDPYFSTGQYRITTSNGSPFGNSLSVQMGPQHMTCEEQDGRVVAVMRRRDTNEPSHIVYGPKPRYTGQTPSDLYVNTPQAASCKWYPWALVKKDGPRVDNDVTVYLHNPQGGWGLPVWKSRHGFAGNGKTQTHTVVTRLVDEIEEVPCCLVLRDPLNHDVFNVTIAPGIDPILTICYLAVHSKMDVEPLLASMEHEP